MPDPKVEIQQATPGSLVRVFRAGLEDGWADGFLVATGPDFFAIHLVDKGIHLDGFNCMRYADVTETEIPAPNSGFMKRALELREELGKTSFPFSIATLRSLLEGVGNAYPAIALHLEWKDPHEFDVGKIVAVHQDVVTIRSISPSGQWADDVDSYQLTDITRVDFGGAYEDALTLVAGQG